MNKQIIAVDFHCKYQKVAWLDPPTGAWLDYETLYNAQDAAGVTALHTGDAVVSEPNQAPIVGGSAIQSGLQAVFDQYDVELSIGVDSLKAGLNGTPPFRHHVFSPERPLSPFYRVGKIPSIRLDSPAWRGGFHEISFDAFTVVGFGSGECLCSRR